VPGGIPGYSKTPLFGSGDFEKDVAEAKRLIAEVRAAGVEIPPFRFITNTHENHAKVAAFVQNVWKARLGIQVEISNQEWGVFMDTRRNGTFEIARGAWTGDYPDPRTFLDLFTTGNPNNDPKYSNPFYDRLVLGYCDNILEALKTAESRENPGG
jgi:oligopeptide transport system substrate-binding protein